MQSFQTKAKLIESDDELLPPTPKVTESKCKPGKHRVKKQVSKTFVDEEGFMVTKKVMESCSETDEESETSNIPFNENIFQGNHSFHASGLSHRERRQCPATISASST